MYFHAKKNKKKKTIIEIFCHFQVDFTKNIYKNEQELSVSRNFHAISVFQYAHPNFCPKFQFQLKTVLRRLNF